MGWDRFFTRVEAERLDELGFLDTLGSPRLIRCRELLDSPVGWVLAPPWLGKTTVATGIERQLHRDPATVPALDGRITLTRLGTPGAERTVPPPWWGEWSRAAAPGPAVWLIDAVDEALESQPHLLELIAESIEGASPDHLRALRLLLFSRPYAELESFRDRLHERYGPVTSRLRLPQYWLTRLGREAAANLVGADRFDEVMEVVRRNDLRSIAGFPIVLNFLKTYKEAGRLTVPDVWRGVLAALLGGPRSNRGVRFDSTPDERFTAACRVAAVLTLTGRSEVREWSPDPGVPSIGTLFREPDNRVLTAAKDACGTALFVRSGEPPAYRLTQRNARDWLTAFALEGLPIPKLHSVLAGADGRLVPGLREPARLLRVIRSDGRVSALIDRLSGGPALPSDAVEPTLAEVLRALDHLEGLAAAAPWGLRHIYDTEGQLARLRVEGLGDHLATRLRDPGRPARVKDFLFDVAEATHAIEAVDAAVELVLDQTPCDDVQHDDLRYSAAWFVTRFGGDDHLGRLQGPIGESSDESEIGWRICGVVVRELLDRGIWPCWRVALHTPRVKAGLLDSRLVVLDLVEKAMTLTDARQLLPYLRELQNRHAPEHHPHELPEFLSRALDLVLAVSPPAPADVDVLVRTARECRGDEYGSLIGRALAVRLRHVPSARRQLYRDDVGSAPAHRLHAWNLLDPDDWRWLRDEALGSWAGNREVWGHALWLATRAREEGRIPDGEWEVFLRLVDEHAPGLRAELDASRQRYEQDEAEQETRRREREARDPNRQPLDERVRALLDRAGCGEQSLMTELSWLCFTDPALSGSGGPTAWADLPADLRHRVLAACRRGLEVGQPTEIPVSGSYSVHILAEGAAFAMLLSEADSSNWLTDSVIRRWLPAALFARMSDGWDDLLAACRTVSHAATEAVLLDAIDLHAARGVGVFVLRGIPADCWTQALTERLVERVNDEGLRPDVRAELLDQLATRTPDRADPVVAGWAVRPGAEGVSDPLRQAGLTLLLATDPATALVLLEQDVSHRGQAALEELPCLWGGGTRTAIRLEAWPVTLLTRLGQLLITAYPPSTDPEFCRGFVTPEHQLRWLRQRLVDALLQRTDAEASAAVDRLMDLDPSVRATVLTHRANAEAARFLPGVDPSSWRDPTALSSSDAVRLLDRAGFRLIRSSDDLLDAVLESLAEVEAGAGHDLSMLYSAPDGPAGRTHLREDALQAYARRRLLDTLGRLADGVEVQVVREDQVARRQRLDLRVTAPCYGTTRLVEVVIEVKWSTNVEVRNGLVDQLGARYLQGEGLTHGVFLVGWSGGWFPRDGSGQNSDVTLFRAFLSDQRDRYCGDGGSGAGLRIEPFVLDLRWSRNGP